MPAELLDKHSYWRGRFVSPAQVKAGDGWKLHKPDWKKLRGACRGRFVDVKMFCADKAGAELTLKFTGTAVGAYVLAGPDAGTVEARVDGGRAKAVDLYHRFSSGLHYPRTVMFATDLADGEHTLTLRVAAASNKASSGHAVRIIQFAAN